MTPHSQVKPAGHRENLSLHHSNRADIPVALTVPLPDAPIVRKMPFLKAVAFAAGLGLSMLSYSAHAAPASGGDTVQRLYDALLSTMKNGRTLGQSGRFT